MCCFCGVIGVFISLPWIIGFVNNIFVFLRLGTRKICFPLIRIFIGVQFASYGNGVCNDMVFVGFHCLSVFKAD